MSFVREARGQEPVAVGRPGNGCPQSVEGRRLPASIAVDDQDRSPGHTSFHHPARIGDPGPVRRPGDVDQVRAYCPGGVLLHDRDRAAPVRLRDHDRIPRTGSFFDGGEPRPVGGPSGPQDGRALGRKRDDISAQDVEVEQAPVVPLGAEERDPPRREAAGHRDVTPIEETELPDENHSHNADGRRNRQGPDALASAASRGGKVDLLEPLIGIHVERGGSPPDARGAPDRRSCLFLLPRQSQCFSGARAAPASGARARCPRTSRGRRPPRRNPYRRSRRGRRTLAGAVRARRGPRSSRARYQRIPSGSPFPEHPGHGGRRGRVGRACGGAIWPG